MILHRNPLPHRVEARDRRNAAIHEAGHLVVGQHFGVRSGSAWLVRHGHVSDWEKTWTGQHQALRRELDRLSDRRQMCIGVAGIVAENVWCFKDLQETVLPDYANELREPNAMSATDWKSTFHESGEPTWKLIQVCEEVHTLLTRGGRLWSPLLTESRNLIRFGFTGAD